MLPISRILAFALSAGMLLWGMATEVRAATTCDPGTGAVAMAEPLEGKTCGGDLVILAGTTSTMNGAGTLTATGNLTVEAGATLSVVATPSYATINVGGNFDLQTNAVINLIGQSAVTQPAGTTGAGRSSPTATCAGSGAGHGGAGGIAGSLTVTVPGGDPYGVAVFANLPGSTGGRGTRLGVPGTPLGGKGGGAIRVVVGGLTTLDGFIYANGAAGQATTDFFNLGGAGGGGSGGSIYLRTVDLTTHNTGARLVAAGGAGGGGNQNIGCVAGGGGGGGRISVYYSGQNGTGTGVALDPAVHMNCNGGARGPGTSPEATAGSAGSCFLGTAGTTPQVNTLTPAQRGQGAANQTLTLSGQGFVANSQLEIAGATAGSPNAGITIHSISVPSSTSMTALVSIAASADASPGANPKPVRVFNPDLGSSATLNLFTVTPAPVIDHVEQGGGTVTGLPRGFAGNIVIHGSNFQLGATVSFGSSAIAATGSPAVDTTAQSITLGVSVPTTAAAGAVTFNVTNPDQGRTAVAGTLQVLSQPAITAISPDTLIVGQAGMTVTVTGSGFIAASQVVTDATDVTVNSVQFNSFNQLTATLSVDAGADLSSTARNLWVNNGDGGVSAPVILTLEAVPAGVNTADLVYGQGTTQPADRIWNGFGWSTPRALTATLPESPDWVVTLHGRTSGDVLLATLDPTRRLYLQERTSGTWATVAGPVALAAGAGRPVDAAAVAGAGGERYLVAYGPAGSGVPSFRMIGGAGATGAVPATNAACTGGTVVNWVRVVASRTGDRAVVVYAPDNLALCAVSWNGTAFDGATEVVLAAAGTLAASATQAFDATYWRVTDPQRAMVAWGVAGSGAPRYAVWDGAAWTTGSAQTAASSPSDSMVSIRLAASSRTDRVALVNVTSIGELYAQFWGGTGWGSSLQGLPAALVSNPQAVAGAGSTRAFDVNWPAATDAAIVTAGLAGGTDTQSRRWTPTAGWGATSTLPAPAGLGEPRWVQLRSDPGGGNLLAGVAGAGNRLAYYRWDGVAWNTGQVLSTAVPAATEAFMADYRDAPPPVAPQITAVSYGGVSPARLGAQSTAQTLTVTGTGFLNPPAVTFGHAGITVGAVNFVSSTRVLVTVSVGAVPAGTYTLNLVNPDGQAATTANGLTVVAGPSGITVRLGVGALACTPTVSGATACALQDSASVPVEVVGGGFVDGAQVAFGGTGVDFLGSPTFSVEAGTGLNVLSGAIQVTGTATPGAGSVTVTNPDSSTGTGTGVFEVTRFVRVDSVTPAVLGAGAQGATLDVRGANFQPGLGFSLGSGVTVNSVTWNGATQTLLGVDVLSTATAGARTVTVTNPDGGTFAASLFSVVAGPTVTSVTPAQGAQGSTVHVVVAGTNLAPLAVSGAVAFSGSGIAVSNVVASATQVAFDAAIDLTAPFTTARDLVITRDNGGQAIAAGAFTVVPVPSITSITPSTVGAGETGRQLTLTGGGFDAGAVVAAAAGLTLRSQTVVAADRIDITVDVGTTPGTVNLTVQNPAGQTSAPAAVTIVAAQACAVGDGQTLTLTPTSASLVCSTLAVSGTGRVELLGDLTFTVLGNADLTGGTIFVDPSLTYARLKVGGNLTVAAGASIDANATGFPGGRLGAKGTGLGGGTASAGSSSGSDSGRGGGYGGTGAHGATGTGGGPTYDLSGLCTGAACFAGIPLEMGSGGGSAYQQVSLGRVYWRAGGAGGGSLVLDVAGSAQVDGTVRATGGTGENTGEAANGSTNNNTLGKGAGGGSGGSVLVLVNGNLSGSGLIRARGGAGSTVSVDISTSRNGTGGGGGRVAVYHGGTNTFSGTLDCTGGASVNPDAAYQGAAGTCVQAPRPAVTSVSPAALAQGASTTVQIQATGLAAGDTILRPSTGFTWGPLTGTGPFGATLSLAPTVALGMHDIVIRHAADSTGAIAFGAVKVVPNPRILSLTPNRLAQGQAAAVQLAGALLEPTGATVSLLRGGVVPQCGGAACVAATVDEPGSSADTLALTVVVDGAAPLGGYDVRVLHANGGQSVLRGGFVVLSPGGTVPALASVSPVAVGAEVSGAAMTLSGYDFGVPPAFRVTTLSASDPNVSIAFDPAGCPQVPVSCVTDPAGLQRIDARVSTVGVTPGTVVDVSVSGPNGGSTLVAAFTVNPRPAITAFTPTSAESAFTLTVSGQNFASGAVISLADPTVAVGATTPSGSDLTATVTVGSLAATSTTDVRVTNPDGGFGVLAGLTLNPSPQVTSLTPVTSLGVGQSATINVLGSHFHPSATVTFGAGITVSNKVFVDAGRITVLVTVAGNATPGSRDVTVTNPNGGFSTLAGGFTIKRPALLTSITPAQVGAGGSHVLLLQGAELDSSLSIGRVAIGGTGVTAVSLNNFRSFPAGAVTITSLDLAIDVDASAPSGPRTLTISNTDGSVGTGTFTVNPPPVVAFADPNVALRNQTVTVTLNGFNLDPAGPRVCFGTGCDFGASSSLIYVTGVTPVSANRADLTLLIGSTAALGFHPITVANLDGGRTTKANVLQIAAGFTVTTIPNFEISIGAGPVAQTLNGTGFTNAPAAPQVAFLLPSGAVDPNISVTATYVSATQIDLAVTVGAGAAPGYRGIRVTNGTGAVREVANFLLVTNPTGPTVGALEVPDGAGGFRAAVLGLDEAATRTVTGARLTGSGLDGSGLTITFGRAGLSASNVVAAVGGKTATFDLALAPTTVPGQVALTAATTLGNDTRNAALTVNIAPALTTLQPATLTPGTINNSVLITGGGFQSGALVAVTPSGVTVRDLNSAVAGTQASFLSTTALRTVLDVGTLTTGAFTLTVTNPDGGRGSASLTVASPVLGTPAKIAYLRESAATGLKVRDWSGAPAVLGALSSNSASLPHVAEREDVWTVLRGNPMVPGEYLMAVGQARSQSAIKSALKLYRTLADGTSWAQIDAVGALSSVTSQAFDLGYEQGGSGRALVVYGVGTTLLFKTVTSAGSSGAAAVLVGGASPTATGAPIWVRLVPEPGGRRILVVYETDARHVQALVWDGAANSGAGGFVSQYDVGGGPLTTNAVVAPPASGDVIRAGFDGAWEGVTGRAVVFWSQNGDNALRATTWDAVNGWAAPTTSGTGVTGTGPSFVRAAADPSTDRIAVLANSDDGVLRPLVGRFYVGGWEPVSTVLAPGTTRGTGAPDVPGINFDLAWDDDGGLVVLYGGAYVSTGVSVLLETRHWTLVGGWSVDVELPLLKRLVDAVAISQDPDSGELLAVVAYDPAVGTSPTMAFNMYRWAGTGWRDETLLATGGVHWPMVPNAATGDHNDYGTAMAVAYREDLLPPAAVTLSQTASTTTTATVRWTATGDNGTTGRAGGYDIRWSDRTIVDDAAAGDCGALPAGQVCFSQANQMRPSPTPAVSGATETVAIDFGASGVYTVAVKVGDRANRVNTGTGAETLWRNVSAISNVLTVTTQAADPIPPEPVIDLAAADGANPESMVNLTWTGVGDDGDLSTNLPVLGYEIRMATLPISEVGGDNNFHVPFDKATLVATLAPATNGTGGTRGVANSHTVTGLGSGLAYYFAVKGFDEDPTVQAAISNVAGHTTRVVTPEAINDLVVADAGVNTVTLAWTARGGAPTSYELRYATFPITDLNFATATAVGGVPAPAASGVRQAFTVGGMLPDTAYYLALVPVRYQTVAGVLTRLAPAAAVVTAATLPDPTANPTEPSAVADLAVVAGTVRTNDARLAWTAPAAVGGQALRYEFRWAHRPLASAAAGEIHVVPVPVLPAPAGTAQEFTVTGLPENALVYLALVTYDRSGLLSGLSNEVLIHTALRRGVNALSVPGSLTPDDIGTLLGPYIGGCTSGGTPTTGSGPVGPCGVGTLTITAYWWDPAAGTEGDFVAAALTDPLAPGTGVFAQSNGDRAVVDVGGTDLPSYPAVALPQNAPALVSNPYYLPVAVADLRIQGDDGYDQPFGTAVTDGVIDPTLLFFTLSGGALQFVPVTDGDDLLPYRAYFIQLGAGANPAVSYTVRMLHP